MNPIFIFVFPLKPQNDSNIYSPYIPLKNKQVVKDINLRSAILAMVTRNNKYYMDVEHSYLSSDTSESDLIEKILYVQTPHSDEYNLQFHWPYKYIMINSEKEVLEVNTELALSYRDI